ncbi:uncharacterized protein V1518DRAFT_422608 [Limtongia smithiae]|uniref:uncharacterized protein n=1 Tax=Limtongia smithiae TaxID=1125753 RepID=UPI0034CD613E
MSSPRPHHAALKHLYALHDLPLPPPDTLTTPPALLALCRAILLPSQSTTSKTTSQPTPTIVSAQFTRKSLKARVQSAKLLIGTLVQCEEYLAPETVDCVVALEPVCVATERRDAVAVVVRAVCELERAVEGTTQIEGDEEVEEGGASSETSLEPFSEHSGEVSSDEQADLDYGYEDEDNEGEHDNVSQETTPRRTHPSRHLHSLADDDHEDDDDLLSNIHTHDLHDPDYPSSNSDPINLSETSNEPVRIPTYYSTTAERRPISEFPPSPPQTLLPISTLHPAATTLTDRNDIFISPRRHALQTPVAQAPPVLRFADAVVHPRFHSLADDFDDFQEDEDDAGLTDITAEFTHTQARVRALLTRIDERVRASPSSTSSSRFVRPSRISNTY